MTSLVSVPGAIDLAPAPPSTPERIIGAARQVLNAYEYATRPGRPAPAHAGGAGPAVLATLVRTAEYADAPARVAADRALGRWLALVTPADSPLGPTVAAAARPATAPLAVTARQAAADRYATGAHPSRGRRDYDLVGGAAGALLALAAGRPRTQPGAGPAEPWADAVARAGAEPRADAERLAAYLAGLCDRPDLERLRDRAAGGRIEVGVAHGVSGVALALCRYTDAFGTDPATATVLRRLADWLVADAHVDRRGMLGWLATGRDGRPPGTSAGQRHGWCTGTPGVAWTLWELGRVIDDAAVRRFAVDAFEAFITEGGVNPNTSVREGLALCHGDTGLLLICDAFHRYAGLEAAGHYRDLLDSRLRGRLSGLAAWAGLDASLLDGPFGLLAGLLAVRGGDRSWLTGVGLR